MTKPLCDAARDCLPCPVALPRIYPSQGSCLIVGHIIQDLFDMVGNTAEDHGAIVLVEAERCRHGTDNCIYHGGGQMPITATAWAISSKAPNCRATEAAKRNGDIELKTLSRVILHDSACLQWRENGICSYYVLKSVEVKSDGGQALKRKGVVPAC
ncbi:hypothetical protein D4A92_23420 (plasmid) [Rhizobium rosettiformans]|uniref:Uncharacterized protein n=1 Tax=Rhizobium rosettiformans TaxID=1368430 RepID=A0ABX7F1X8_9HYPH|nr:hypothetical protein D4A92_23420 [Rhizobium rosettiformans]